MTRRNLAAVSVLLIFLQSALSLNRALTLTLQRRADIDLYHHDPLLDIIANYGIFAIGGAISVAMLFWRRRALWIGAAVLLVPALAESIWLVAADFGGLTDLPLLFVRGGALIVLLADETRRQFE
jgi:hypothetical protein